MSTNSFQLSNKGQREFIRIKFNCVNIIRMSDSYHEAYSKISKIKLFGNKMSKSLIDSILTSKEMVTLNPKIARKRGKSGKTGKSGKKGSKKK